MHIKDMNDSQHEQVAQCAVYTALGAALTLLQDRIWLVGVLGFVLIAMGAVRLRGSQPGFDRVQLFASLGAACKLVCMALSGLWLAAWLGAMVLGILQLLLVFAVWKAFGRMCADGNRLGRAALCAQLMSTALTLSSSLLGLAGFVQAGLYEAAQQTAFGFMCLAELLLVAFLFIKRNQCKEDTP